MAICGSFYDIPLPDVMAFVAQFTGRLGILQQDGDSFDLEMREGIITHVFFNGQEITDPDQTLSFLIDLIRAEEGEFEFKRGPVTYGPHCLKISEVLLSSLVMLDEIQTLREHLPQPQTVFVRSGMVPGLLSPEMTSFWRSAYTPLQEGASALDLYAQLGLCLDQVQLKLYKLRAAGLIKPQRTRVDEIVPVFVGSSAGPDGRTTGKIRRAYRTASLRPAKDLTGGLGVETAAPPLRVEINGHNFIASPAFGSSLDPELVENLLQSLEGLLGESR